MSVRRSVVPVYLFTCLLLGGSTQIAWATAILQLSAIAILAWVAMASLRHPLTAGARGLAWLVAAMVGLILLHLLPLPAVVWEAVPGRMMVRDGLAVLGLAPGWQSLSLAPYDTVSAALALLPPITVLAGVVVLRAYSRTGVATALLTAAMLGLALGTAQVGSPIANAEQYYLQPEVNAGTPSGFFANPNHMATMLLVALPFAAALLESGLARDGRLANPRRIVAGGGAMVVLIIGLVFNRSLAGWGLLLPVVGANLAIVFPTHWRRCAAAVVGMGILALAVVLLTPTVRAKITGDAATSVSTRQEYVSTSLAVARTYAPFGSGIGSFARVYRMKEDPRGVDATIFVNHTHNDYVELLVEVGVPGAVLALFFLLWWGRTALAMRRTPSADSYARAGMIASAVILLHSLVDFPLRTSAISACLALSIGLMLVSRRRAKSADDVRPTRHLEIR